MIAFEYKDSPFPIRGDIRDAHRVYWARLASPGSWWSGSDRVAIAAESRAAREIGASVVHKTAVSTDADEDKHESECALPSIAVDVVHRVVMDQTAITQSWIQSNAESGLGAEAYVELVGIVVAIISIDEFHRALGLKLEALPDPLDGEPDHYQPNNLSHDTGFVPMIPRDGAVGREADLWAPEFSANVLRALSLVPDAVRAWKDLASAQYLSVQDMRNFVGQEDRSIDRAQMEIVAGRVSSYNECFY